MMATYIGGKTPFPEFSVELMLNDIVFAHYDSKGHEIIHRGFHKDPSKMPDKDDLSYANVYLGYIHDQMKDQATKMKDYFKDTNGKMTYMFLDVIFISTLKTRH